MPWLVETCLFELLYVGRATDALALRYAMYQPRDPDTYTMWRGRYTTGAERWHCSCFSHGLLLEYRGLAPPTCRLRPVVVLDLQLAVPLF
jgi:hypothetical protein